MDTIGKEPAANYFGGNYAGAGDVNYYVHTKLQVKLDGAWTERGSRNVHGIYYRSSFNGKELSESPRLKLHEAVHLAFPEKLEAGKSTDLDTALVAAIGLTPRAGETDSEAVSRFFRNACDQAELN